MSTEKNDNVQKRRTGRTIDICYELVSEIWELAPNEQAK